jgi:ribosomal protein L10
MTERIKMTKSNFNSEEMAQQLKDVVKNLADFSDVEALIENGTLEKQGVWFKAASLNSLPESVSKKIKEVKPAKDGVLLKFENSKRFQKLAKKIGV